MKNYKGLKEEAYEANMKLNELGLVIFTFGNTSAADRRGGVFAIKPSGVAYSKLNPSDMVVLDFNNVGIIKNLLNSKPGLLKFLRTTLSARWNGKSTNGRIGNENNQNRFIAEKIKIRINDILSALVNN